MNRITSRQNPVVARYRAAARGGPGAPILLDGLHLVADAVAAGLPIRHAAVSASVDARGETQALIERMRAAGVPVIEASAPVMAALSPVRSPSALVALADRPGQPGRGAPHDAGGRVYAGAASLVVMAVGVQDPGNLGAIVRVAEAAGATGVVTAGRSADPFGWKALRGSMGSALRLPIICRTDISKAIADARHHGCRIVATTPRGGLALADAPLSVPLAILIGGEGGGLTSSVLEAADERVTIPMRPPVESLNAAIATALIVYEARRRS